MLKSEVCINGIVTRDAVTKTNHEGQPFVSFGMRVSVPGKQGECMMLDISVSRDGTDCNGLTANSRVEAKGVMTFKKRGEKIYLNLHAIEMNLSPASASDMITGILSFRGTIGKTVDSRNDKNGKPYQLFCGYSAEKVDDAFEYTWVRFIFFSEDDAVKAQGKIEAKGDMELSVYKDKLNISCRVSEVKEWVKQPYQASEPDYVPQLANEELPI